MSASHTSPSQGSNPIIKIKVIPDGTTFIFMKLTSNFDTKTSALCKISRVFTFVIQKLLLFIQAAGLAYLHHTSACISVIVNRVRYILI